jgi:hypothetical protein
MMSMKRSAVRTLTEKQLSRAEFLTGAHRSLVRAKLRAGWTVKYVVTIYPPRAAKRSPVAPAALPASKPKRRATRDSGVRGS